MIEALNERRAQVARVDPADIGAELLFDATIDDRGERTGRLCTASRHVELAEVGAVYYRRPTPYATRFAHLPARQSAFATAEAQHGLGGILRTSPHQSAFGLTVTKDRQYVWLGEPNGRSWNLPA
ncbi:hypothetical protein OHB15_39140 [Streptosporangium subroseum]|nr:hypothetical protein OHB15_39140 [Streptosporangium subroseum]